MNIADSKKHIRGLDGIRGIAALMVVFHHTAIFNTRLGGVAVYLFFTLSGYLITGILFKSRSLIESRASGVKTELHRFWINRIIRIFPVYYLTLLVVFLASLALAANPDLTGNLTWYLCYAQNFLIIFKTRHWGILTHAWSLAVEQQFYIIFPFIALVVPRRYARRYIAGLCLVSLTGVAWLAGKHASLMDITLLPPLGFLFLFTGGFLSTWEHEGAQTRGLRDECLPWMISGTLLLLAIMPEEQDVWSRYFPLPFSAAILDICVLCGLLIWSILRCQQSLFVRLLELPPLRFSGSISYAFYLVHVPISYAVRGQISGPFYHGKLFLLVCSLSVILATCSFYLIEHPLAKRKLRLKDTPPVRIQKKGRTMTPACL